MCFNIWVFTFRVREIIACCTNYPGNWHDSCVAEGIYAKLENETPNRFSLVADSVFPHSSDCITGKTCVPLKAGEKLPIDTVQWRCVLELS